ncbi:T9SS type A sorting domain-containing protein [uncultured Marixanthomonas sp.]|uniref:T9SS type A sorting domain-containing protein n=1 Tax=uncultured Marixanthomonas sp. TaxID=757245 RepID=UPI0030D8D803|tara:strand:- start:104371 stop:105750 length:1380 start_codon:yes stop_codon:yes gene_type:complete
MKNICVGVIVFFCSFLTTAQSFGPQDIISENIQNVGAVSAADINGDGNNDVLVSYFDGISWFENMDGAGMFGSEQPLTTGLGQSFSIVAADIDNDGDMDVLATSFDNRLVMWFENTDGQGNFGTQQIIDDNGTGEGADNAIAADVDGDGDLDVIAGFNLDYVAWYINLDGTGNFGPRQVITNTVTNGRSIQAADFDGDGDIDIATSSSGSITVAWFENTDGEGTFGPVQIISGAASAVETIFVVDLDGDDDMDIVAGTPADDIISWYENTDGLGSFGSIQIISNEAVFIRDVLSIDVDNDGDMDVVSASAEDDKIAWYENVDGTGSFGGQQIIDSNLENPRTLYAADLDGDGYKDVLSGTRTIEPTAKLVWYKNQTDLGIGENNGIDVLLYPNPVKNILYISAQSTAINSITVYTVLGEAVLKTGVFDNSINLSSLPTGTYFVKIETDAGSITKEVIKE